MEPKRRERRKVKRLTRRVSVAVKPADYRRAAAVAGWPVSEVFRRSLAAGLPAARQAAEQAGA